MDHTRGATIYTGAAKQATFLLTGVGFVAAGFGLWAWFTVRIRDGIIAADDQIDPGVDPLLIVILIALILCMVIGVYCGVRAMAKTSARRSDRANKKSSRLPGT